MIAPAPQTKTYQTLPQRRSLIERPGSHELGNDDSLTTVQKIVSKHPAIAVAAAGLLGVALGCLVKRRGS